MAELEVTRIDLPESVRRQMITLLNEHVGLLVDLGIQVKLAHWNVRGPLFIAYHQLFDTIADHVGDATDALAERATTLGGRAGMPVQAVAAANALPPWPEAERRDHAVIALVAERLALAANRLRRAIDQAAEAGDAGTADLFTEVGRSLDKDLWLLEAHSA